jgi:hypothetical protein
MAARAIVALVGLVLLFGVAAAGEFSDWRDGRATHYGVSIMFYVQPQLLTASQRQHLPFGKLSDLLLLLSMRLRRPTPGLSTRAAAATAGWTRTSAQVGWVCLDGQAAALSCIALGSALLLWAAQLTRCFPV